MVNDKRIRKLLRRGSQYSLTWDMVDFRGRMLNVPRTKNEEPIHVPLNDSAVAALRVVHSRGEGKRRVFQSAKTGGAARKWAALVRRRGGRSADQELSLARLARYICEPFANERRFAGGYCKPLLGHESLTMTRRYAHLGPNKLHAVVSLLRPSDTTSDTSPNDASSSSSQVVVQ